MAGGEEYYPFYIANCIFNSFMCYSAIVLNIVTIHAIRRTSSLPKPLKTLLLSLSVSDLAVGLVVHPLYIAISAQKLQDNKEDVGQTYNYTYNAFLVTANLLSFASFFGVIILSADRFLAIHLHLRYRELVTRKRVCIVIIIVWVFSTCLSLLRLWLRPMKIIYVIFAIVDVACLLPAAVLNYKIFAAARQHEHQLQDLQVRGVAQNEIMANVGRVRKSAIATAYLYLLSLACYLPHVCILWIIAVTPGRLNQVISRYTFTLSLLNLSLNPFIYCWKLRHVRHAVMNIFRSAFSRQN